MKFHLNDFGWLKAHAESQRGAYLSATPYPHIVIDGFLYPEILKSVLAEFPDVDDPVWREFGSIFELKDTARKLELFDVKQMGPVTQELIRSVQSDSFMSFLEILTSPTVFVPL